MIFGKSNEERAIERRAKLEAEVYGVRKFVVLRKLESGQWAFMQHVWAYRSAKRFSINGELKSVYFGSHDDFYIVGLRYYADKSDDHVRIEVVL